MVEKPPPRQGAWVPFLVWEDSTCPGRTKRVGHNWVYKSKTCAPKQREATAVRSQCTTTKQQPHLPQIEKTCAQQQWSNAAKNEFKKKKSLHLHSREHRFHSWLGAKIPNARQCGKKKKKSLDASYYHEHPVNCKLMNCGVQLTGNPPRFQEDSSSSPLTPRGHTAVLFSRIHFYPKFFYRMSTDCNRLFFLSLFSKGKGLK